MPKTVPSLSSLWDGRQAADAAFAAAESLFRITRARIARSRDIITDVEIIVTRTRERLNGCAARIVGTPESK